MRFRDHETGRVFESIRAAFLDFCTSWLSRPSECGSCPLSMSNNGTCSLVCSVFAREHPVEAAKLMGYEIIEDVKPSVKNKKPLSEWTLGEVRAECVLSDGNCEVCLLHGRNAYCPFGEPAPYCWDLDERPRMTILIDMDDTIECLCAAWVSHLNRRHGTNVRVKDVICWDVSIMFPELTKEQVYAPLLDDAFWEEVEPKDGAVEYVKRLMDDGHTVYIVTTSSYETLRAKMNSVLFKYFPYLTWGNVIVTSNKQMIKGDVLVDDGVHNLEGGAYHKVLMDAPHNRSYNAEKNGMTRVHGWEEAYRVIGDIANSKMMGGERL